MPRKFLFVSLEGLIGDTAWAVAKEGHDVKYFIANEEERQIADGFVEKSDDWRRDADWADVIVFDDVLGQGTEAHRLRQKGKLVVGGTPYTDRARGRSRVRSGGAPSGRRQHYPAKELHFLRRSDRLRARESEPLRHQAEW